MSTLPDHGLEVLRKAGELVTPGDPSNTYIKTSVISSSLPNGAATEATLQSVLSAVNAIETATDDLEAFSDNIEPLLTSILTAAQNISTYTDGLEALLTTIRDNADQVETFLSSIGSYTDGIEGLLTTIRDNADTLETLITAGNVSLSSIDGKVSTTAKQDIGNTSLSSIDTKLSSQATAANQTTGNASLSSIDTKISTTNTSLSSIDAGIPAGLGQTTMASSMPVVLSSDQAGINSFLDKTITGFLVSGDTTSRVELSVNGLCTVVFQLSGTWTGSTVFEYTVDGSTYSSISGYNVNNSSLVTSSPANGSWRIDCAGFKKISIRRATAFSGTVVVDMIGSVGGGITTAISPNLNNFIVAAAQTGNWNLVNISGTISLPTGASTSANQTSEITAIQNLLNTPYTVRIDEVSGVLTYTGWAAIGAAEGSAVWKITKYDVTGTVTSTLYADGNNNFDNVWTNRASLTYS